MAAPRAYISGPLQAAADLAEARRFYEALAEICTSAGFDAYLPHQRTDPEQHPSASPIAVFRHDHLALGESDLVIAHVGQPSSGVGVELGIAFCAGQPIVALYHQGERPSRFVLGMLQDYEAAQVIDFADEHDLRLSLTAFLKRFAGSRGRPAAKAL
jgi:nucleoside 2-deoxyribosyltransferase